MFSLDGFWLIGALAIAYFVGVVTSQWAKDKIKGVPSDLRAALTATETAAVKELSVAKSKVVADTASLLAKGKAAVAAAPAAPVPAAVVAAAATAAAPAPAPAPAAAAAPTTVSTAAPVGA